MIFQLWMRRCIARGRFGPLAHPRGPERCFCKADKNQLTHLEEKVLSIMNPKPPRYARPSGHHRRMARSQCGRSDGTAHNWRSGRGRCRLPSPRGSCGVLAQMDVVAPPPFCYWGLSIGGITPVLAYSSAHDRSSAAAAIAIMPPKGRNAAPTGEKRLLQRARATRSRISLAAI
jgi:hypothetical protein